MIILSSYHKLHHFFQKYSYAFWRPVCTSAFNRTATSVRRRISSDSLIASFRASPQDSCRRKRSLGFWRRAWRRWFATTPRGTQGRPSSRTPWRWSVLSPCTRRRRPRGREEVSRRAGSEVKVPLVYRRVQTRPVGPRSLRAWYSRGVSVREGV